MESCHDHTVRSAGGMNAVLFSTSNHQKHSGKKHKHGNQTAYVTRSPATACSCCNISPQCKTHTGAGSLQLVRSEVRSPKIMCRSLYRSAGSTSKAFCVVASLRGLAPSVHPRNSSSASFSQAAHGTFIANKLRF